MSRFFIAPLVREQEDKVCLRDFLSISSQNLVIVAFIPIALGLSVSDPLLPAAPWRANLSIALGIYESSMARIFCACRASGPGGFDNNSSNGAYAVDVTFEVESCTLYGYVIAGVYKSQSRG